MRVCVCACVHAFVHSCVWACVCACSNLCLLLCIFLSQAQFIRTCRWKMWLIISAIPYSRISLVKTVKNGRYCWAYLAQALKNHKFSSESSWCKWTPSKDVIRHALAKNPAMISLYDFHLTVWESLTFTSQRRFSGFWIRKCRAAYFVLFQCEAMTS